jgi:hypothetical protein
LSADNPPDGSKVCGWFVDPWFDTIGIADAGVTVFKRRLFHIYVLGTISSGVLTSRNNYK